MANEDSREIDVNPDHADIFEKIVDQFFRKVHEEDLIVLKGHLLIEELLTEIINESVRHPRHVEATQLRFAQKVKLARSFSLAESENETWELIEAINSLRNDLAHALASGKKSTRIERVKDLYFKVFADDLELSQEKTLPDSQVLAFAIAAALGFLGAFRDEARFFSTSSKAVDRVFRHMRKKHEAKPKN